MMVQVRNQQGVICRHFGLSTALTSMRTSVDAVTNPVLKIRGLYIAILHDVLYIQR
jgi:hypothetical protein